MLENNGESDNIVTSRFASGSDMFISESVKPAPLLFIYVIFFNDIIQLHYLFVCSMAALSIPIPIMVSEPYAEP
jgi:hypothetical protein